MIERFSICAEVIKPSRAPVSVWISSFSAVTVTSSVWAPTSRAKSNPLVSLGLTLTPFCVRFLKPESSALRV